MSRCISRKDYLKKGNTNVGYALYIQDKIKKDDYVRLNTGKIVKVIGIMENKLNKKAIYYDNKYGDWFDAGAVENFSENIIDLIEVGDYVNEKYVSEIREYKDGKTLLTLIGIIMEDDIKTIVTHEQYKANCYTVIE